MTERRAIIAGATGLVGGQLLDLACQEPVYTRVLTLGRRAMPLAHDKHEHRIVDFSNFASFADAVAATDDVFCCLGTTIKTAGSRAEFRKVDYEYPLELAKLTLNARAQQFLLVSALGANANSSVFYNRVKGELERELLGLGLASLSIFRPSLLLGERKEFRLAERIFSTPMRALGPLLAGPLKKYRGIEARDVARAMIYAALRAEPGAHSYESDRIFELAHTSSPEHATPAPA